MDDLAGRTDLGNLVNHAQSKYPAKEGKWYWGRVAPKHRAMRRVWPPCDLIVHIPAAGVRIIGI